MDIVQPKKYPLENKSEICLSSKDIHLEDKKSNKSQLDSENIILKKETNNNENMGLEPPIKVSNIPNSLLEYNSKIRFFNWKNCGCNC